MTKRIAASAALATWIAVTSVVPLTAQREDARQEGSTAKFHRTGEPVGETLTVGATTRTDARSSFSNFGSVVDIFAPRSSILSAYYTSNSATATLSGTSMAAPHVAGVAARYLQNHTGASPATVRNALVTAATTGRLAGIPSGTANRLLFWSSAQ